MPRSLVQRTNGRFAPKAVGRRDRFSTQAGHASDAPGGPSIFGRFALATGPQEIVRMGKMGKGNMRVRTGLPPWRRSADRTRLHANSLLTGNFTGSFAILGLREPIPEQEIVALQPLLEQFPKQINREKIAGNREFLSANREFHCKHRDWLDRTFMSLAAQCDWLSVPTFQQQPLSRTVAHEPAHHPQ
jgi:hypothetical protein